MKSPITIKKKGDKPAAASNSTNGAGSANGAGSTNGAVRAASPIGAAPHAATAVPAAQPAPAAAQFGAPPPATAIPDNSETVDLERRRAQLSAKVAELQWDLGGLVYEMAIRNRLRPDVIVTRAAALQDADAELGEVERILRMERTGVAALCLTCGAPHSAGAVYCWQCGNSLLEKVPGSSIAAAPRSA